MHLAGLMGRGGEVGDKTGARIAEGATAVKAATDVDGDNTIDKVRRCM